MTEPLKYDPNMHPDPDHARSLLPVTASVMVSRVADNIAQAFAELHDMHPEMARELWLFASERAKEVPGGVAEQIVEELVAFYGEEVCS